MGLVLKFSILVALRETAGFGYLLSTALAVEAVLLHNFTWHLHWTWRDRSSGFGAHGVLIRCLRFHLTTGAVAMAANLGMMGVLTGTLGIHYVVANAAATMLAALANFTLNEWFVFAAPGRAMAGWNS